MLLLSAANRSKISSENHREIAALKSFLIKLQAEACKYIKKRYSGTGAFLRYLQTI